MPARSRPRPTAITWTGIAYRATSYDVPLWSRPNRGSGRWNIAGDGCTQHMCLDANAPFAEALRHEDLRTEAEAATYRTTIWQIRADQGAVVDYSTFERAEAAGFPADALVEDDHERCQAEAAWLKSHGMLGLLAPSAALPGSLTLALFGPRVAISWDATVELASTMPAGKLTTGPPPTGLISRIRYFGETHAALMAYQSVR